MENAQNVEAAQNMQAPAKKDDEKMDETVKKVELHIVVGCADARDISAAFNDALAERMEQEFKNGTLIDFQRMSVAGSFMTAEIINEIKTQIQDQLKEYYQYYKAGLPLDIFVHVTTHGNAVLKAGRSRSTRSYHDIEILESQFSCGMTHAQEVAIELEEMLLRKKSVLEYGLKGKRKQIRIETEEDIEKLMKNAYGHDGTVAGNWVKSIVNIRTHAYEQKKILRRAFDTDPTFANLGIMITAGVKNYLSNEYFRVDGITHLTTFIDTVYEQVRKNDQKKDKSSRTGPQNPVLGLLHHSAVQQARATAVKHFFGSETYSAGQVYAIGSMNLPDYYKTFGPYKVVGFFYGVKHLGLLEWVVMGRDAKETGEMQERIMNDPLMGYIVKEFSVKLVTMDPEGNIIAV